MRLKPEKALISIRHEVSDMLAIELPFSHDLFPISSSNSSAVIIHNKAIRNNGRGPEGRSRINQSLVHAGLRHKNTPITAVLCRMETVLM